MNIFIKCVCCAQPKKYKCPKCCSPYCSSACFKSHSCAPVKADASTLEEPIMKSDYIDEEVKMPKRQLDLLSTYSPPLPKGKAKRLSAT